jgi:hypothetical protein
MTLGCSKHYVYISDSMVDMLYRQILQKFVSKIAAELKLSLFLPDNLS